MRRRLGRAAEREDRVDEMTCPHQIVKGERRGRRIVQCAILNDRAGWPHGFPDVVCLNCSGEADRCAAVERFLYSIRRLRVTTGNALYDRTWDKAPSVEIVCGQLRQEHRDTDDDILGLLIEAVGRGMTAEKAASVASGLNLHPDFLRGGLL